MIGVDNRFPTEGVLVEMFKREDDGWAFLFYLRVSNFSSGECTAGVSEGLTLLHQRGTEARAQSITLNNKFLRWIVVPVC